MKKYNILATMDFTFAPQIGLVAVWESYSGESYESIQVEVPDEWATVLELSLNQDDNVVVYDEVLTSEA